MNEPEDIAGKELWRKYSAQAPCQVKPAGAAEIDPNVLAAYLDGTADAQAVEQVEARMAADAAFLEEVIELRAIQQAGAAPAPAAVVARAQALVRGPAASMRSRPAPALWQLWWGRLQWAAVAAGILLACWAGYTSGRGTLRAQRAQASAVQTSAQSLVSEPEADPTAAQPDQNGGAL